MIVFGLQVAQHDGRSVEPTGVPQRAQVGHEVKVAVTLLPVGKFVARDRLHLHVDGEQVIAGVRATLDNSGEKMLRVEAFSH